VLQVAVELCKVLLNLQNNYAIDDFADVRRDAMATLAAVHPKPVKQRAVDGWLSPLRSAVFYRFRFSCLCIC